VTSPVVCVRVLPSFSALHAPLITDPRAFYPCVFPSESVPVVFLSRLCAFLTRTHTLLRSHTADDAAGCLLRPHQHWLTFTLIPNASQLTAGPPTRDNPGCAHSHPTPPVSLFQSVLCIYFLFLFTLNLPPKTNSWSTAAPTSMSSQSKESGFNQQLNPRTATAVLRRTVAATSQPAPPR
jgi:hypothetical protein